MKLPLPHVYNCTHGQENEVWFSHKTTIKNCKRGRGTLRSRRLKRVSAQGSLTGSGGSFRLGAHGGILILREAAVLVRLKVFISSHTLHQFTDSAALPSGLLEEFKHILAQFL